MFFFSLFYNKQFHVKTCTSAWTYVFVVKKICFTVFMNTIKIITTRPTEPDHKLNLSYRPSQIGYFFYTMSCQLFNVTLFTSYYCGTLSLYVHFAVTLVFLVSFMLGSQIISMSKELRLKQIAVLQLFPPDKWIYVQNSSLFPKLTCCWIFFIFCVYGFIRSSTHQSPCSLSDFFMASSLLGKERNLA